MSEKQMYVDKITRDEIKEAMKRFFEKGGQINKIESNPNQPDEEEQLDSADPFIHDDPNYYQISVGIAPVEQQ